ncbi:hypothetical protein [Desulfovibrio gilichinskyi]|uniref:Uncharacterized protein n=1 Tax=Desulfovibrio gilichinskyi TaxID=1519643 RepID=A0A1X7CRT7_9BACT|nr:hypothetical protein [Desulfovibrio gilichinskyi]SMF01718.1 hypothetical protein SAMN06295933_1154 [Desulfovibrio gilichinskyi]
MLESELEIKKGVPLTPDQQQRFEKLEQGKYGVAAHLQTYSAILSATNIAMLGLINTFTSAGTGFQSYCFYGSVLGYIISLLICLYALYPRYAAVPMSEIKLEIINENKEIARANKWLKEAFFICLIAIALSVLTILNSIFC